MLSVSLLLERTFQDAQYRLQLELIDDLLSPRAENAAALTRRAGQFGLANHLQLVVRVVGVSDDQRQRALSVLRHRSEGLPGIIALHESHLCIIEPWNGTTAARMKPAATAAPASPSSTN